MQLLYWVPRVPGVYGCSIACNEGLTTVVNNSNTVYNLWVGFMTTVISNTAHDNVKCLNTCICAVSRAYVECNDLSFCCRNLQCHYVAVRGAKLSDTCRCVNLILCYIQLINVQCWMNTCRCVNHTLCYIQLMYSVACRGAKLTWCYIQMCRCPKLLHAKY